MNRKIKLFVSCLAALFIGLISFIGVKSVNAYELNSDNNLVSANLCDMQNYSDTNVNVNNNNISLTGVSNFNWISLNQTIVTSQTIYVQLFGTGNLDGVEVQLARGLANFDDRQRILAYNTLYSYNLSWDINYIFIYNQNGNVNNLNIMISYSTITEYEPYGTWYNENYLRSSRMGILSNLDYLQPNINNQSFNEYSINDLFNNGLITNDNSINLISINNDVNTSYEPIKFDFYLDNDILKSQFKLAFSKVADINSFVISGYNSANPNVIYSYTLSINELPTYFDLTDYDTNNIDYINYFSIFFNSADQVVNINGNIDYYNGYNAGLEVANRWQNMYNELETSYNSLKQQYNDLLRQYNNYINGNVTLDTLIWNIATTPFETFKTIWDVDILGVNLGSLCVGLMFVGIALYIWRKFI